MRKRENNNNQQWNEERKAEEENYDAPRMTETIDIILLSFKLYPFLTPDYQYLKSLTWLFNGCLRPNEAVR